MLQIHDIKPIVEIPSYSFYIYLLLITLAAVSAVLIIYFTYNYFKNKKNVDEREYLKILKDLDFEDPKKTAYTISIYGWKLAKSERQIRLMEELNHNLEEFKYKKDIDKKIPLNIKSQFDRFMESLDVR